MLHGIRAAVQQMIPNFERATGHKVKATFGSGGGTRRPLPRDISTPTALVGFLSAHSKEPDAAKALLRYLSSPEAAPVYKERGMQPGR